MDIWNPCKTANTLFSRDCIILYLRLYTVNTLKMVQPYPFGTMTAFPLISISFPILETIFPAKDFFAVLKKFSTWEFRDILRIFIIKQFTSSQNFYTFQLFKFFYPLLFSRQNLLPPTSFSTTDFQVEVCTSILTVSLPLSFSRRQYTRKVIVVPSQGKHLAVSTEINPRFIDRYPTHKNGHLRPNGLRYLLDHTVPLVGVEFQLYFNENSWKFQTNVRFHPDIYSRLFH